MEMGEIKDQRDLQIDYKLYVKFWKLQDFFVNPTMIYNHENWLVFENNLADVLSVFTSNKLDRPQDEDSSNRKIKTLQQNGDSTPNGVLNGINGDESISNNKDRELESFSAKYLTSQKLFHLQIADSQFRRYFLTQCLIFTNYLSNTNVKSRE
jgi:THO complex subunit 1